MNKDQHEKLMGVQNEIRTALKDPTLTPENRRELENLQVQLAGQAMSSWLPIGWPRRILALIATLVGFYGLISGPTYLVFALLFAATFSPRIVGEILYLSGMLVGKLFGRS